MSIGVRTQPYRLDPSAGLMDALPQIITNVDEMFQMVFEDMQLLDEGLDSAGGGVETVVSDTNITGVIAGTQLTLGFTGELAVDRGGTGVAAFTPYAVVLGGTTGAADLQDVGALGTSGQVLTSQGAAAKPQWVSPSTPTVDAVPFATTRKPWSWFYSDLFTSFTMNMSNPSGVGSLSNVQDATSTWKRQTTSSSADAYAGLINNTEGPHLNHLPTVIFHIRTGNAITEARYWAGLFDSTGSSTAPGTSATGVLTRIHASFRYVEGTDTQWVGSVGDGTTQTVSANLGAIAADTSYVLKIRFTSSTTAAFSINGGAETVVTLASNAGDSTDMYQAAYVANKTGGNTRRIDIAGMYGEMN